MLGPDDHAPASIILIGASAGASRHSAALRATGATTSALVEPTDSAPVMPESTSTCSGWRLQQHLDNDADSFTRARCPISRADTEHWLQRTITCSLNLIACARGKATRPRDRNSFSGQASGCMRFAPAHNNAVTSGWWCLDGRASPSDEQCRDIEGVRGVHGHEKRLCRKFRETA